MHMIYWFPMAVATISRHRHACNMASYDCSQQFDPMLQLTPVRIPSIVIHMISHCTMWRPWYYGINMISLDPGTMVKRHKPRLSLLRISISCITITTFVTTYHLLWSHGWHHGRCVRFLHPRHRQKHCRRETRRSPGGSFCRVSGATGKPKLWLVYKLL